MVPVPAVLQADLLLVLARRLILALGLVLTGILALTGFPDIGILNILHNKDMLAFFLFCFLVGPFFLIQPRCQIDKRAFLQFHFFDSLDRKSVV